MRERLSQEERREVILRAALRVFGERGFHGTTTKALAEAAGVSEALLFRHFASKEDIYTELQTACWAMKKNHHQMDVESLDDSAASLVTVVHYLMSKMLLPVERMDEFQTSLHRLLANSFLEDGSFARGFMKQMARGFIAKLGACVNAAKLSGDLNVTPVSDNLGAWLVEHLASMLMLNNMPGEPVVRFEVGYDQQVEQATWFALLGLGLKPEVIQQHYRPQAFAFLMS